MFHVSCFMFNVSCIHNTPQNATRVKSSIELAEFMKSPGSIHEFSYILTFPDFTRHFFSSLADSVDTFDVVVLNR